MATDLRGAAVALTGASGFIGSRIAATLTSLGARVAAFDGDLLLDDLLGWMKGADHLIHLAARSGGIAFQGASAQEVFSDNVAMTRRVLEAATTVGVGRAFLASSGAVYSRGAGESLSEDAQTISPGHEPITGYAWSKLTDENMGRWFQTATSLEVVCGRFANVYGPGGPFGGSTETVVHALIRKAFQARNGAKIEVWGDGAAVRNFLYIDDAVSGALHTLVVGAPGSVYNIASDEATTIRDLARQIAELAAPGAELEFDASRPTGPRRRVLNPKRLQGLGWDAEVDLVDGVRRTVAWWEDHRCTRTHPPR